MSIWENDYDPWGDRRAEPAPVAVATTPPTRRVKTTTNLGDVYLTEKQSVTHSGETKIAPRTGWYSQWINGKGRFCIAINFQRAKDPAPATVSG